MRRLIFIACLALATWVPAFASSTLTFEGADCYVEFVVGHDAEETIGGVLFTPPGQKTAVALPQRLIRVLRFDSRLQILELLYVNSSEPQLPPSFSLSVEKRTGVLLMDGKRTQGIFEWSM